MLVVSSIDPKIGDTLQTQSLLWCMLHNSCAPLSCRCTAIARHWFHHRYQSWQHFADLGIDELLVIVLLLKRRLIHDVISSFGEAKQLPLPWRSKGLSCSCLSLRNHVSEASKVLLIDWIVQVTELLMDYKQTKSSLAFCKTPVTAQLRFAIPVVLQNCWASIVCNQKIVYAAVASALIVDCWLSLAPIKHLYSKSTIIIHCVTLLKISNL